MCRRPRQSLSLIPHGMKWVTDVETLPGLRAFVSSKHLRSPCLLLAGCSRQPGRLLWNVAPKHSSTWILTCHFFEVSQSSWLSVKSLFTWGLSFLKIRWLVILLRQVNWWFNLSHLWGNFSSNFDQTFKITTMLPSVSIHLIMPPNFKTEMKILKKRNISPCCLTGSGPLWFWSFAQQLGCSYLKATHT